MAEKTIFYLTKSRKNKRQGTNGDRGQRKRRPYLRKMTIKEIIKELSESKRYISGVEGRTRALSGPRGVLINLKVR